LTCEAMVLTLALPSCAFRRSLVLILDTLLLIAQPRQLDCIAMNHSRPSVSDDAGSVKFLALIE
jgi:hypothetical protein